MTRTVMVTGAAAGIGLAAAQRFDAEGWEVVGLDIVEAPVHFPGRSHRVDVSDASAVDRLFRSFESEGVAIDVLVNNAALQICKRIVDTSPAEWDAVMATNLRSAYLLVRAAYLGMCERSGGAIVNVSSVHAKATSVAIGAYAASKGGLVSLTRALALELAPDIRVNAVLPGAVDTDMLRAGLGRGHGSGDDEEAVGELAARTPAGRVGRPEEIAEAILFLADGSRSGYMTGQTVVVDGGALARLSTE